MNLKQYYKEKSIPVLKKELKIKNELDLPKVQKIVVSIGLSQARFSKEEVAERIETIKKITGQKPIALRAKKAISNFKLRQGQIIAYMATLRGIKMYDFLDKLINIVLPRIRDFRGIATYSFDKGGNFSLGIKEHIVFPEIKIEEVKKMHGLGITVITTAESKNELEHLLKSLGAQISGEKKKKEEEKLESLEEMREKREKKEKEAEKKTAVKIEEEE